MYNYREEIKKDIVEALKTDYESREFEELYDKMWVDDSITGNGSGSYTFDRELAKKYVLDNMEVAVDAFDDFSDHARFTDWLHNRDYESIDVTIRCYLLGECLQEVLDENNFE